jgi:hypothetical protein
MNPPTKKIILGLILPAFILLNSGWGFFFSENIALAQEEYINREIIKETSRVSPLMVISNTSPKKFHDMIIQDIKEVLGATNFKNLLSDEEIERIVAESIQEGTAEALRNLMTQVAEGLSQEISLKVTTEVAKKVTDKVSEKVSTTMPESCLGLGELINQKLNTSLFETIGDLSPKTKEILLRRAEDVILPQEIKAFINSSIYDYLSENLRNTISDRIINKLAPTLADSLTKKLTDYLPGQLADLLSALNNYLQNFQDEVKNYIASQIVEPIIDKIVNLITSFIQNIEWLKKIAIADEIKNFLKGIITPYIEAYIEEELPEYLGDVYNFQQKLEEYLTATLYDLLSEDIKDTVDKSLLDIIPANIGDFITKNFIDMLSQQIGDFLKSDLKALLGPEINKTLDKSIVDLLLPEDLRAVLHYTILDLLPQNIKDTLRYSVYEYLNEKVPGLTATLEDFLTQVNSPLSQRLINLLPEVTKKKIGDLLSPEYAWLKDYLYRNLSQFLLPEKYQILTKRIGEMSDEELSKLASMFNETPIEMMGNKGEIFNLSILEMMSGEGYSLFTQSLKKLIEKRIEKDYAIPNIFDRNLKYVLEKDIPEISQTPLQILKIEEFAKKTFIESIASTDCVVAGIDCQEAIKKLLELVKEYTKEPRPWYVKALLNLEKSPLELIKERDKKENTRIAEVLDQPLFEQLPKNTQDTLDTSLWDALPQAQKETLTKSLLSLLPEKIGKTLSATLLGQLPEKYRRALTTPLGDMLKEEVRKNLEEKTNLERYADKTLLELITDPVFGTQTGKNLIEVLTKRLIDLIPGLSILEKTTLDIINENTDSKVYQILSKSLIGILKQDQAFKDILETSIYSKLSENIRKILEKKIYYFLPDDPPGKGFKTVLETEIIELLPCLLPQQWQVGLAKFLGLSSQGSEQLISEAVNNAVSAVEPEISEEIEKNLKASSEGISDAISFALIKNLAEETGYKLTIEEGGDLAKKLSKKIAEDVNIVLNPDEEKEEGVPLSKKINEGFILNSLKDL